MNTIQLINVTKTYKNGVTALHDVSLTLKEGNFISVMGQSGSGKSTLLQIAGLLDICTSGNVIINNEDVSMVAKNKLADIRLKSLGFVFQAFNLNSHLKVYENIMVPMLINPDFKDKAQMKKRQRSLQSDWGFRTALTIILPSFRAANSKELQLQGLWQTNLILFLPMNRQVISTVKMKL